MTISLVEEYTKGGEISTSCPGLFPLNLGGAWERGWGNLLLRSVKRLKKDKQMHFTTCEEVEKRFGFVIYSILKTVHLQQFKGMQSSKQGQLFSLGYVM